MLGIVMFLERLIGMGGGITSIVLAIMKAVGAESVAGWSWFEVCLPALIAWAVCFTIRRVGFASMGIDA